MSTRPLTKIGHAFEEYAGARLLLSKVDVVQQPSCQDEHVGKIFSKMYVALNQSAILDPTVLDMEAYMAHVSQLPLTVTQLAEELPKLSMVGFEEHSRTLHDVVQKICGMIFAFPTVLFQKVSLGTLVSSLNDCFPTDEDVLGDVDLKYPHISTNQEHFSNQLARQCNFLMQASPKWKAAVTTAATSTIAMLQNVMMPIAKDHYATFSSEEKKLAVFSEELHVHFEEVEQMLNGAMSSASPWKRISILVRFRFRSPNHHAQHHPTTNFPPLSATSNITTTANTCSPTHPTQPHPSPTHGTTTKSTTQHHSPPQLTHTPTNAAKGDHEPPNQRN